MAALERPRSRGPERGTERAVRSSSSKSQRSCVAAAQRMLRIEFKGKPYDWFNLEELGGLVRSSDFAGTLWENVAHYFGIPFEYQVAFDEQGVLATTLDLMRALGSVRPRLQLYDLREMPFSMRAQVDEKLSNTGAELTQMQQRIRSELANGGSLSNGAFGFAPSTHSPPAAAPLDRGLEMTVEAKPRLQTFGCAAAPPIADRSAEPVATGPAPFASTLPLGGGFDGSRAQLQTQIQQMYEQFESQRVRQDQLLQKVMQSTGQLSCGCGGKVSILQVSDPAASCLATASARAPDFAGIDVGAPGRQFGGGTLPLAGAPPRITDVPSCSQASWTNNPDQMINGPAQAKVLARQYVGEPIARLVGPLDDTFEIALTKDFSDGERGKRFGFANVPSMDGDALIISWIDHSGLLAVWNHSNPSKFVREGDVIVSCNGVSGDIEGMRLQLQSAAINMRIRRSQHLQAN